MNMIAQESRDSYDVLLKQTPPLHSLPLKYQTKSADGKDPSDPIQIRQA